MAETAGISGGSATPAEEKGGRDRLIDAVRAGSLCVVVIWHWVFTVVVWQDDGPHASNPIGYTSGLWALTWLLQVMPLFFFCGGYAHIRTWRSAQAKGQNWLSFIVGRIKALAAPALVAIAVVGAGAWALSTFLDVSWAFRAAILVLSPLWFLIVYLMIVLLVPAGAWLRDRFGQNVLVVGIGLVIWIDLLRFHFGHAGIAWVNMVLVWALVHQAGFDWPAWRAMSRRSAWSLIWGGLIGLSALTNMGLYPRSMVGVPGERFSNMGPPTVCILALAVFQVGVLLVNRERLERFIESPGASGWVDRLQGSSMRLFLWHVPAYAVAYALVWAVGYRTPQEPSSQWWLERPFWFLAPALICVAVGTIALALRGGRRKTSDPTRRSRAPANDGQS